MTKLLVLLLLWQGAFKLALPGFEFSFPRDHGNHPEYKFEWWYWTGHLVSDKGRRFGFQVTFFRVGIKRDFNSVSNWSLEDLYPAHFAITDIETGRFLYYQKLSRTSPGSVGSSTGNLNVWNQNWSARVEDGGIRLQVNSKLAALDLRMKSLKDPVIHGENGISPKGNQLGQSSHYYSLTRLSVLGHIRVEERSFDVNGQAWMDHEFSTNQLAENQIGWDWFSLQLDNNFEVMLFQLRTKNGSLDPNSAGTVISPEGEKIPLDNSLFQLRSVRKWISSQSGIEYPVEWQIFIPEYQAFMQVTPLLENQELDTRLSTGIIYWEGAVEVKGSWQGKPLSGLGYMELTGYQDGGKPNI